MNTIHPSDLQKKYRLGVRFFNLLKSVGCREKINYNLIAKLGFKNLEGKFIDVNYRLLYLGTSVTGIYS